MFRCNGGFTFRVARGANLNHAGINVIKRGLGNTGTDHIYNYLDDLVGSWQEDETFDGAVWKTSGCSSSSSTGHGLRRSYPGWKPHGITPAYTASYDRQDRRYPRTKSGSQPLLNNIGSCSLAATLISTLISTHFRNCHGYAPGWKVRCLQSTTSSDGSRWAS